MLTPHEIIVTHLLPTRRNMIEIAEVLDAYDAAVARSGQEAPTSERLTNLRKALALLADPTPSQTRRDRLIDLFATREASPREPLSPPQAAASRAFSEARPHPLRRSRSE
jgi:hypothetical protein